MHDILPDIPALTELKSRPQWVAWARETRNGRSVKIPVNPLTGANASSDDPRTWGTYAQACKCARTRRLAGIGYMFGADDDVSGFDLDGCIDGDGKLEPWAADVVALRETYAERSPSGRGIHFIARGKLQKAIVSAPAGVEAYSSGRYFAMTGDHIDGTPTEIGPAPKTLAMLQERVTALKPPPKERPKSQPAGESLFTRVNGLALANLAAWVPAIFGADAEPQSNGGFRVSSAALGRELQEALSLHPSGIVDFGVHDMGDEREGKRTPIDVVIEHGADVVTNDGHEPDAMTAARWLCEQLDVDPVGLERPNPANEFSDVISDVAASLPGHWARMLFGLPAIPSPPTQPAEAVRAGLGERDAGDDDELWGHIPPREWLLGNVFCRGFLSSLLADGGTGKTALRIAQLIALAVGRPLTGEHVFQRCRVLIVSLEDGERELRRRIRAACIHHGITRDDLNGWLFVASLKASDGKLMVLDAARRPKPGPLLAKLENTVAARRIDVVSIDPFVKAHAVEENQNSAIDEVVQTLTDLADRFHLAVDTPHHVSKGTADPGNANRGRGASAMKDAARLVYTLTAMTETDARAFRISGAERRSLIRMDSAKVNIAPPMTDAKWFRLVGVRLGNATATYPKGDSVQTVEPWKPADAFEDLSDDEQNDALNHIAAGLPDGNRYSSHHNAVNRAAWKVVAERCLKTEVQAKQIIKVWGEMGLLREEPYDDPQSRKEVFGLVVDDSKRPGSKA